jgi:hypothetical protein
VLFNSWVFGLFSAFQLNFWQIFGSCDETFVFCMAQGCTPRLANRLAGKELAGTLV